MASENTDNDDFLFDEEVESVQDKCLSLLKPSEETEQSEMDCDLIEDIDASNFNQLHSENSDEILKRAERLNAQLPGKSHRIPKFVSVPTYAYVADRKPLSKQKESHYKDTEVVFAFATGTKFWVESEESVFATENMNCNPTIKRGFSGCAYAVPALEFFDPTTGQREHIAHKFLGIELAKVIQYGFLYQEKSVIVTDMAYEGQMSIGLEEELFSLGARPSNVYFCGPWDGILHYQKTRKKKARLVVSGSAVGVSDEFIFDEVEQEIIYLKDQGYDKIELVYGGCVNKPLSRGEMRVLNTVLKMKSAQEVDLIRFSMDYSKLGDKAYLILNQLFATMGTHGLHFSSGDDPHLPNLEDLYNKKKVDSRTLTIEPAPSRTATV